MYSGEKINWCNTSGWLSLKSPFWRQKHHQLPDMPVSLVGNQQERQSISKIPSRRLIETLTPPKQWKKLKMAYPRI